MPPRRALLLDACCVVPGSHNPRACRLFGRAFAAQGFAVGYLIPRHGAAEFPGEAAAVERVLPYPYGAHFGTVEGSPRHPLDSRIDRLLQPHRDPGRRSPAGMLSRLVADSTVERLLTPPLTAELDRVAPAASDLVMLPTADLYVTGALLRWLARRPVAAAPAVLLRFLGKLETEAVHRPYRRLKALLRQAAQLRGRGYRIQLAAEVEPWADRLQRRSGLATLLLPTPPDPGEAAERPPARLGVSLLSLRRSEQGSERLVPILRSLPADLLARLDVVAQAPRLGTADALAAAGARIVAEDLPEAAMAAVLAGLDVTLLPYLPEPYSTRGSSMLFEAANHGHAVLASAGCGFSAEVERFDLGRLCTTDREFALALAALARDEGLRARSRGAADRYNAYRRACFDDALAALGARP